MRNPQIDSCSALGLAQAMALTSKILSSIIYYHITCYDYLLSKLEKEAMRRGISGHFVFSVYF
jgi:hypothetical protein